MLMDEGPFEMNGVNDEVYVSAWLGMSKEAEETTVGYECAIFCKGIASLRQRAVMIQQRAEP